MENKSTSVSRFSRMKYILLFGAVLLVVAFIIGLILVPGIIKNYINKNGKELAGRMVHIDKLRYNYFTSTLQINGFKYF